jgi:hypothetical protein
MIIQGHCEGTLVEGWLILLWQLRKLTEITHKFSLRFRFLGYNVEGFERWVGG